MLLDSRKKVGHPRWSTIIHSTIIHHTNCLACLRQASEQITRLLVTRAIRALNGLTRVIFDLMRSVCLHATVSGRTDDCDCRGAFHLVLVCACPDHGCRSPERQVLLLLSCVYDMLVCKLTILFHEILLASSTTYALLFSAPAWEWLWELPT